MAVAGESGKEVIPALLARAIKAMGEDAGLQVFAKSLFHVGWRGVMVALVVGAA